MTKTARTSPKIPIEYKNDYYISDKAVEKLRHFVAEVRDRTDDEIRAILNEAIAQALFKDAANAQSFTYEGVVQKAVDLSHYFKDEQLKAIVARNERTDSPQAEAVITLVTRGSFNTISSQTPVGSGILAEKLSGLAIKPAKEPLKQLAKEEWLVVEGNILPPHSVLAEDVAAFIGKLIQKGSKAETIRVYRPVEFNVKVSVNVEIK